MQHEMIDSLMAPHPPTSKYAAAATKEEFMDHVVWKLHRLPMIKEGQLVRLECYCCSYIRYPRVDTSRLSEVKMLNDHVTDEEMRDFISKHGELVNSQEGCGCGSELSRRKKGFHDTRAFCTKWSKAPERHKSQCTMQYNGTSRGSKILQYFELEFAEAAAPPSNGMTREDTTL